VRNISREQFIVFIPLSLIFTAVFLHLHSSKFLCVVNFRCTVVTTVIERVNLILILCCVWLVIFAHQYDALICLCSLCHMVSESRILLSFHLYIVTSRH